VSSLEEYIVTAGAPRSTSGRQMRVRLAENFFHRWWLYILPVLLLTGVGAVQAKKISKEFRSFGSVNVASKTALTDLTALNAPNFGYETPAAQTTRNIGQLMSTDAFAATVATNAGLSSAIGSGQVTLDGIRGSVKAVAGGDNLVIVSATTLFPDEAQRLAMALITSYTDYVLTSETAGYKGAISFLQSELASAKTSVEAAQQRLDDYFTANPTPKIGNRPDDQALKIQRLNNAIDSAQKQYDGFQANIDEANLSVKQAQSDIGQRLQVVDQPRVPAHPEPIIRKRLFKVGVFFLLGLVVAGAALLLTAMADRTVRAAADITGIPGLKVIATIPTQRRHRRGHGRIVPALTEGGGG
jgi:uncharacterized protein involved in exopolysaccharide biosynthesis